MLKWMRKRLCLFLLLLLAVPCVAQLDGGDGSQAYQGLAETMLGQGNFGEAKKLALLALQADPDSSEARVVLAKVGLATGDLEDAQVQVTRLLELDEQDSDHQALQGMILMLEGKTDAAIDHMKKGIELGESQRTGPEMATYANTLVLAYHQNEQADLALKTCLDALQKYPEEIDLYLSCSRLYREQEDYKNALDIAQKGLALNPDFPGLYGSVALAQMALGQPELANEAYLELKARDPELAEMLRETLDGQRLDEVDVRVRVD